MTTTSDFITLSCPTCGGKLQITEQIERFVCAHCRNEHLVRRESGMIYLSPLVEGMRQIRTGVDKTAAELAISRLQAEIQQLEAEIKQREAQPTQQYISPPDSDESFLSRIAIAVPISAFGLFVLFAILQPIISFLVIVIAAIVWLAVMGKIQKLQDIRLEEADAKAKSNLAPWHDRLARKRAELQKNQQLVEA